MGALGAEWGMCFQGSGVHGSLYALCSRPVFIVFPVLLLSSRTPHKELPLIRGLREPLWLAVLLCLHLAYSILHVVSLIFAMISGGCLLNFTILMLYYI